VEEGDRLMAPALVLQNVLADVRRGVWRAPHPEPAPPPVADPTFHEFASEWWAAKRDELSRKTQIDYEWQLSNHLLPFFARPRLTQITVAEVDRYRNANVAERALSAASINKTLTRLGQILDVADEYELIQRNPLRVNPRNRKLRAIRPAAVWLDRADQIESLLAAAGGLDQRARPDRRHVPRRAKTEAGVRHVDLLPALRELLATCKAGCADTRPNALVFATSSGKRQSGDNFRDRVFVKAFDLANERRTAAGLTPLPEGLTPHKLRHTCCSLLFVCGYELPRVMAMLGHADSAITLRIYAHVMAADDGERERLKALVAGTDWEPMGTSTTSDVPTPFSESRS
jgi:integrase